MLGAEEGKKPRGRPRTRGASRKEEKSLSTKKERRRQALGLMLLELCLKCGEGFHRDLMSSREKWKGKEGRHRENQRAFLGLAKSVKPEILMFLPERRMGRIFERGGHRGRQIRGRKKKKVSLRKGRGAISSLGKRKKTRRGPGGKKLFTRGGGLISPQTRRE